MPWTVKKGEGNTWLIVRKDTGEVVGHSKSEAMAKKSVVARYIGEYGKNKPKGKKK